MPKVCWMLAAGHLTLTPQHVRRGRSDFPMLRSAKEFTLPTDIDISNAKSCNLSENLEYFIHLFALVRLLQQLKNNFLLILSQRSSVVSSSPLGGVLFSARWCPLLRSVVSSSAIHGVLFCHPWGPILPSTGSSSAIHRVLFCHPQGTLLPSTRSFAVL